MSRNRIVIATRESALALWQAEFVKAELEKIHSGLQVELLGMTTKGDQILDSPLAKIGGKGLFVKELEAAMLDGRADIAVHSMKDVPMEFPEGLGLAVVCEREEPWDAFVSNQFGSIDDLPEGAVVGSSSLRRQAQLLAYRPDLQVKTLRGNVNTRLRKLDDGEYDAIILAHAGLLRLGFHDRIAQVIGQDISLPAVGQGAVGIECRSDDEELKALLAPLGHLETTLRVTAERAMNRRLEGGCQVPIAGFAQFVASDGSDSTCVDPSSGHLHLTGLVGSPDGKECLKASADVVLAAATAEQQATQLGIGVAESLLDQGADRILKSIYTDQ